VAPWLLVLAWYAVIFWFSAQPGEISDAQSGAVERLAGVEAAMPIRKSAHVLLFFGLGVFSCPALWLRGLRRVRLVLATVGLCAALAGLDEFHQFFVPERAALLSDVGLDTLSAAVGAAICAALLAKWRSRARRHT
jgi:VanZ family protein